MNEVYQYVLAHQEQLSTIALTVILAARMIAALTPSKSDDELLGSADKGLRKALELISGAGHRNLIKPSEQAKQPATADVDEDPFDALSRLVDKFEGKIVIVPKGAVK